MKDISTHKPLRALLALAVIGGVAVSGCGYLKQSRENVPMRSVAAVKEAQTLNPEAGNNRKVVAGLDGSAASNVNDGYAKSFERKSQQDAANSFQGLSGVGE